ncbi:hypothetical protein SALBM217S_09883 [Streptomyces griseoloalbus]
MGIGSHMPRTMEENHVTPARRSAYPQRVVGMSSGTEPQFRLPAASAVPGPRAGSTSTTSTTPDSSGDRLEGLEGLPRSRPTPKSGLWTARALSKTLFERLESLEEGAHEYAYIRNTLVELNLALVKFAASGSARAVSRWRTSSRSAPSA